MRIKHFSKVFGLFMTILVAVPAMAATFEVPRSYEIMYVDLESSSQFGNDFKVDVAEGEHQIVVRFNKLLRSGGDAQSFKSEPIVLNLWFDKNSFITLKAPYISNKKQAQANAKDPQFTIHDDVTGQEVDYKQQNVKSKSGFQNTRDYLAEVEKLTKTSSDVTVFSGQGPRPAPVIMSDNVPLEMMQFWYNQSDAATRKEARIWLNDDMYKPNVSNIQLEMFQFWYKKADNQSKQDLQAWLGK